MIFIRYLALVALVVWVGGMVILGLLVAPQTFRVLQASNPADGRILAGALFGAILRQFHLVAYACGAVLFVCLFAMKFLGPPPHAFVARVALVVIMLALTLYSGVPVTRELAHVQSQVSGPISQLLEGGSAPRAIRPAAPDFDDAHDDEYGPRPRPALLVRA